jgi:hypothetical protein
MTPVLIDIKSALHAAESPNRSSAQTPFQCANIANTITPATMTHHVTDIAKSQVLRIMAASMLGGAARLC